MQLVPQVKEVGVGAGGLKHAATERSGERSDLNKGAVSPRWLMREMWGGRQGQRLPRECLLERVLTSLRIRTPLGDAEDNINWRLLISLNV